MTEAAIRELLAESRFDFVRTEDKEFIVSFNQAMQNHGWELEENQHYKGYMWGRFMFIYCKSNVKAKKVAARLYMRDDGVVLRMFFSKVDKHRAYIENAPSHIKEVFVNQHGNCGHCGNERDGVCSHRKVYTIDGKMYEKCDGAVFEFHQPSLKKLPDYMALLDEFYKPARPAG